MSKNSKECYACKRPTSTFALSSHLVPWHEANEDISVMPLEVYHPNFSVFKFTIIFVSTVYGANIKSIFSRSNNTSTKFSDFFGIDSDD